MEALRECYLYEQPVTAPIFEGMSGLQAAKCALLHRQVNCIKKSKILCSDSVSAALGLAPLWVLVLPCAPTCPALWDPAVLLYINS